MAAIEHRASPARAGLDAQDGHAGRQLIDALARQHIESFLTAVGGQDLEILCLQPRFEQLHIGEDVINDEYAGGHGLRILPATEEWGFFNF